jgi:hypothetical protein
MGYHRLNCKVDTNHTEIVKQLRQYPNISVKDTHILKGFVDIIVGYKGFNYLIEIKFGKGKLTEDEIKFQEPWKGQVDICRSVEEILKLINYK